MNPKRVAVVGVLIKDTVPAAPAPGSPDAVTALTAKLVTQVPMDIDGCGAISLASATIAAVAAEVRVSAEPVELDTNWVVAARLRVVPFQ